MIELKQYPTQEDFLDGIARCNTLIQTALGDIQYLAKRFSDGNYYMTEDQVADYMKCTVDEIPKMPKYRAVWSRGYIYKKSEVDDFIESKAVGKKKSDSLF